MIRVLVVEDGFEYSETLPRVLPELGWERVGTGAEALTRLAAGGVDVVFLDMRFDRIAPDALLGDLAAETRRLGDAVRARRHLEEHQGTYILSAIRAAGLATPVLLSYGFDEEPRRWERLSATLGPVDYVPDAAGPDVVRARLLALAAR